MTIKIALSYSHRDEALRKELETHLSALQRQGLIDTWHDRKIIEGREFDGEIDRNFDEAQVILLLVSPDFIASDYCYNVEMTRALERHRAGTAKVLPVILRRCHWQDLPFGKLLATPVHGKPVTEFPSHDAGFFDVVSAVKRALKDTGNARAPRTSVSSPAAVSATTPLVHAADRSSNLRMKRKFTDQDRDVSVRPLPSLTWQGSSGSQALLGLQ